MYCQLKIFVIVSSYENCFQLFQLCTSLPSTLIKSSSELVLYEKLVLDYPTSALKISVIISIYEKRLLWIIFFSFQSTFSVYFSEEDYRKGRSFNIALLCHIAIFSDTICVNLNGYIMDNPLKELKRSCVLASNIVFLIL